MNRPELVKTLNLIKPALATKDIVPIFQCFMFDGDTVSAYNDTVAIAALFKPDEEMTFAVHGNTLLGLLESSLIKDTSFALKGNDLILTIGKSISKLPYTSRDDFIFEQPEGPWQVHPFTNSFMEAMELCFETVSTDETQIKLQGVHIQGNTMYSCNGDTITKAELPITIGKGRVMLPNPFCSAVLKLWASLEMTAGQLEFNGEWVHVCFEGWDVYGRVLEVPDPIDFEALIKRTVTGTVNLMPVPEGLSEALSRARVLADPESKRSALSIAKGKLKLLTETPMGEVKDELPIKGHPDIETLINAGHVYKALMICDQIAFHDNCTVCQKEGQILQIVSNMG